MIITTCPKDDCDAEIQASVPAWLTLGKDGAWSISGFGDEDARYYCGNDHPINDELVTETLSEFLESVHPGTTWTGSAPVLTPVQTPVKP